MSRQDACDTKNYLELVELVSEMVIDDLTSGKRLSSIVFGICNAGSGFGLDDYYRPLDKKQFTLRTEECEKLPRDEFQTLVKKARAIFMHHLLMNGLVNATQMTLQLAVEWGVRLGEWKQEQADKNV